MKKYGVDRDSNYCEECGEKLTKVDGRLVCLSCDQQEKFGSETKVKTVKAVKKWK